jgi:hypothetical protein
MDKVPFKRLNINKKHQLGERCEIWLSLLNPNLAGDTLLYPIKIETRFV